MHTNNVIDIASYRKKETRTRQKINKGKKGSVYSRNGMLCVGFQYLGMRIRERSFYKDTNANRIIIRSWVDLIIAEIEMDCFDFAKHFPYSTKKEQIAILEGREVEKKPEDVTFGEYVEGWFEVMLPGMSSGKIRDYKSVLKNYLLPYFKDIPFSDFTTFLMKKFLAHLKGLSSRLGKDLSPATIRNIFIPLRVIANDAIDEHRWGGIRDPFSRLDLPSIKKFRVLPFNREDWKTLISYIPEWYGPYFRFAVQTGLRPSEQVALKWSAIDDKYIHIELSRVGNEEKTELKTDSSRRMIPLRDDIIKTLKEQKEITKGFNSEYVFLNMDGNVINQTNLSLVWKLAMKKSGLPVRRMYETRHTFASWAIGKGESPEWVARILGHVNTTMVYRTYSRYIPDFNHRDGIKIGNFFGDI